MKLVVSPKASKHLEKIGPMDRKKIARKIDNLKSSPLSGKQLQGEYMGLRSLRVWPLRIIYSFDPPSQIIEIIDVDYRGNVYQK